MSLYRYLFMFAPLAGTAGGQSTSLNPLVVEGAAPAVSKTVPTAAESREELAKTAGGTETVEAGRFLQGRASTMADTFALSPGVVAQPRFGSDEARLSIRGSGMQRTFHGRGLRLLQDGIPLNLADGGFDMQSVDPLAVNHINILRGGNALTLGASTLGGAIDYISATGRTDQGGSARFEVGSFEYLRARVETGFQQGAGDGYLSFSEHYQQGFRDHAEQHNQRFFSNFGWQISDNAEMRVFVTGVRARSELPGSLTKMELEADSSQADGSPMGAVTYDNRRDFELYRIAQKTTVKNGNDTFDFVAAYTYKDLDHPITPFVGVIDHLSNDIMLGGTYTHEQSIYGHENRLRAGGFFTHGNISAATFKNELGKRGALTARAEQDATNWEGFIENQLELGHGFTGIFAATAARNKRENEQLLGKAPSYDRSYTNISPKLGVRWDAANFQVYGNYSTSYEPPSFSETNSVLTPNKAQTAGTFELGSRGSYENFRWDATVYASEVKNEFLSLNNPAGTPLGTTNAEKTIHQGAELFGEVDLLGGALVEDPEHRLFMRGAWTYGRFKFDDDKTYGNNTIAGLAPHLIRGELVWENKAGYYAGPTFEWVPVKAYVDQANTLSADPFALLGFKFGRRLENSISWFVEAKNLTNETYAATTGVVANAGVDATKVSRSFQPGDGRGVFAGIEWKW